MDISQLSVQLRPRKLDEVYGQPKVVGELKVIAKKNTWPTAMLMKGSTGTGKSTVAYITAAMINCSHPDADGNPCGVCPSCLSIMEERFDRDTFCMNANEDGGKSKVLELIQLTEGAPMYDNKKVFIIEEADALTGAGQSALLKLLETPKSHVHFILLSMTDRIPKSIVTRCQPYAFRSFNTKEVMLALKGMMEKLNLWNDESIPREFKFEGLATIAGSTDGSLREATQYLQKCLIGKYYTREEIRDSLGIVGEELVNDCLLYLLNKQGASFFSSLGKADIEAFFRMSYANLVNAAVYKFTEDASSSFYEHKLREIAGHLNHLKLLALFDELSAESKPYLNRSYFLSKMVSWFNTAETKERMEKKTLTVETRPVRVQGRTLVP